MNKYYVVIDTNVLVSAMLKWDSVPGSIVQLGLSGVIKPLYDEKILHEYSEVLSRDKFHFRKELVSQLINEIVLNGIKIDAETLDIEMPDPKDRVFYEIVMEARKTEDSYLVTGNIKHFPQEPFIVTPREMLDIILKNNFE